MAQTSLFYYQDQFLKTLPREDWIVFNITGAATNALILPNSAILSTYAALTQAQIDAFFGSVNEILADKYDATAMGNDAQGVLVNFNGQVNRLVAVTGTCYSSTGGSTAVTRQTQAGGLTASTIETAAVLTANGNVGLKFDWGNTPDFDGLTAGTIAIRLLWVSN